jgi:hypothetical protein
MRALLYYVHGLQWTEVAVTQLCRAANHPAAVHDVFGIFTVIKLFTDSRATIAGPGP